MKRTETEYERDLTNLKKLTKSSDGVARLRAVSTLVEVAKFDPEKSKEALSIIMELLKDGDWSVHEAAVNGLHEVLDERPEALKGLLPAILEMMKNAEWFAQSWYTHFDLDEFIDVGFKALREALPFLVKLVEYGDEEVRRDAVNIMGEIVKSYPETLKKALPTIIKLLNDGDRGVRIYAYYALYKVVKNISETLTEMIDLLESEDENVRRDVSHAFCEIMTPKIIDSEEFEEILPAIVQLVGDKEARVRKSLARAIGEIIKVKPEALTDVLTTIVKLARDREWRVRRTIVIALERVPARNLDPLKSYRKDLEKALAEHGYREIGEIITLIEEKP